MKTCLVIGGTGFIGSHLVNRLTDKRFKVIVLDNKSVHSAGNLNPKAQYIWANISQAEICKTTFNTDIDVVMYIPDPTSDNKPDNIKSVIELCTTHKIPRLIYAKPVVFNENNDCIYPVKTDSNLEITSFQMPVVYGEHHDLSDPPDCPVTVFIRNIMDDLPITIYGDGTQTKDYMYVGDTVNAWIKAIDNKDSFGKHLYLGTNHYKTIGELADAILACFALDRSMYPLFCKPKHHVSKQSGEEKEIQKSNQILNWYPKTSFDDGLAKVIKWEIDNKLKKLGYRRLKIPRFRAVIKDDFLITTQKKTQFPDYNPHNDARPPWAILNHEGCNPHHIKCRKFNLIAEIIDQVPFKRTYLDIGCETGGLIKRLRGKFDKSVGIDINPNAIQYAISKTVNLSDITFAVGDGTNLDFLNEQFDCITCLDVIEHTTNPELLVSEVYRLLNKNGIFIIAVPQWYDVIHSSFLNRKSKHLSAHTLIGWKRILHKKGFKIQACRAVDFPLINSSYLAKYLPWLGLCLTITAKKA